MSRGCEAYGAFMRRGAVHAPAKPSDSLVSLSGSVSDWLRPV